MRAVSSRIPEVSRYLPEQAQAGHLVASLPAALYHAAERALDTVFVWHRRWADRLALQSMDDRLLRDIGLSRADVEVEGSKPFWRE